MTHTTRANDQTTSTWKRSAKLVSVLEQERHCISHYGYFTVTV